MTLELLSNPQMVAVTGTRTRIEVSGVLVRAARRGHEKGLLAILVLTQGSMSVTVVSANQVDIESEALVMVRAHGLQVDDGPFQFQVYRYRQDRHLAMLVRGRLFRPSCPDQFQGLHRTEIIGLGFGAIGLSMKCCHLLPSRR